MSLRRAWLQVHRWLALTLGLVLALTALLGALLTVARPLDRWANAHLFQAPPATAARLVTPLESAQLQLQREFGPTVSLTFRPPREPGDTLWVLVRGPWDGTIYLDPATLRELGRRAEDEGVYPMLFELHSALLAGDIGKAVLTVSAASYLVLLCSGLVLWWPKRWSRALWRIEWRRGGRRVLFDAHRAAGSLLGLLILFSVASGAYMAWRPLSQWITTVAGVPATAPPKLPAKPTPHASAPPGRLPLDAAVQAARAQFPGALVGYVQVPPGQRPVRVRFKLADDPHPNGLSSAWLHPHTGELLRADRWNTLDPGARAYAVVYPLHTGELGGPLHRVWNGVAGLLLFGLAASGLWLWWRRQFGVRRTAADGGRETSPAGPAR